MFLEKIDRSLEKVCQAPGILLKIVLAILHVNNFAVVIIRQFFSYRFLFTFVHFIHFQ